MVKVEHTPADAPAIVEGGTGRNDGSPGLGVKRFFTVSYAKSCTKKHNEGENGSTKMLHQLKCPDQQAIAWITLKTLICKIGSKRIG